MVLALHETGEKIDTSVVGHDLGLDTLIDTGDGDAGQVFNSLKALGEEAVGDVLGKGDQGRHAAERGGDLTTTVQDLDGSDVLGRVVGALAHFGNVLAFLEHAEGSAESQVTDNIKSQVIEPVESVETRVAGLGIGLEIGDFVPLLHKHFNVAVNVLLELADGLGAEGVRDCLTLASVFGAVASVEETTADRDEGIVEVTGEVLVDLTATVPGAGTNVRLQETIAVSIDTLDRIVVGNGDVSRSNSHELAMLLVGLVD